MATVSKFAQAREQRAQALAAKLADSNVSATLAKQFSEADIASANNGFAAVLASRAAIPLTFEDLAVWSPRKADAPADTLDSMELVIRDLHRITGFEHSAAGQAALKNALYLAVHASNEDAYNAARNGGTITDDDGATVKLDGERRGVGARKFDATQSGDVSKGYQGTPEDAAQELDNKANANDADEHERACYALGLAAINKPTALRDLAGRINRMQKASDRWRNTLYVVALQKRLEDYAASNPATSIGKAWYEACAKAAAAHKEFMKDAGGEPNPARLEVLVNEAVDEYLASAGAWDVKGGSGPKSKEEKIADCVKALWANARKYNKHMGVKDGETKNNVLMALRMVLGDEPSAEDDKSEDGGEDDGEAKVQVPQPPAPPAPPANAPKPRTPAKPPVTANAQAEIEKLANAGKKKGVTA